VKYEHVSFEICKWTVDKQTNKHTVMLTAVLHTPTWDEVTMVVATVINKLCYSNMFHALITSTCVHLVAVYQLNVG